MNSHSRKHVISKSVSLQRLTLFVFLIAVCCSRHSVAQHFEASESEFIDAAFVDMQASEATVELKTLWLTTELKEQIRKQFDYRFHTLRQRYWLKDGRTVWVLEEIGKERPITIGVVIEHGKIHTLSILAFRESRGGEVRYPFFTSQFYNVALSPKTGGSLDKRIDGITGATMSVQAVRKVATLALFLHNLVVEQT